MQKFHLHTVLGPNLQTYAHKVNYKRGLDARVDLEGHDAWVTGCFGGVHNVCSERTLRKSTGDIHRLHR